MIWNNVLLRLDKAAKPAQNPEIPAKVEEIEDKPETEEEEIPEEEEAPEMEEALKEEELPEPAKEEKEPEVIDVYTTQHKRFRVRMENNPYVIMSFDTKEEAIAYANSLAAKKKTNVTIK